MAGMNSATVVKRQIFSLGLICFGSATFGQGLVMFNNRVTTTVPVIDAPVYYQCRHDEYRMSGTDPYFHAALLGGPTNAIPVSVTNAGTLQMLASPYTGNTWVTFRTGTLAGYLAVGTDAARDSGLPYGSTGMFQMVAWYGTETTWTAAYNDWKFGLILAGFTTPLILPVSQNASDFPTSLTGLQPWVLKFDDGPAPYIFPYMAPTNQTVPIGSTLKMTGYAGGMPTPTLQWQFNGSDILGATGTLLTIPNVSLANAGNYRLVASNSCDFATSSVAVVIVNKAMLTAGGSVPEGFRMTLTGETGVVFRLQGSSNLAAWTTLGNFTNQSGSLQITDQTANGVLKRFYRAVLP
jgi:hypothetical protein